MSFGFSTGNAPGFTTALESEEVQILRTGPNGQDQASTAPVIVLSSSVDSGNTPTTTLRGGQVMGYVTASGKVQPYGAPSTDDGRDQVVGLLPQHLDMLQQGTATDRNINVLKSGLIRADQLLDLDYNARAVLARMGFIFDGTLPEGAAFLVAPRASIRKDDDYTVTVAENGCRFIQTGADKTFTLPTIAYGLTFDFVNASFAAVDDTMVINGANNILFGGSQTVDTITAAAGGAVCRIRAEYTTTSTLKWVPELLSGTWS